MIYSHFIEASKSWVERTSVLLEWLSFSINMEFSNVLVVKQFSHICFLILRSLNALTVSLFGQKQQPRALCSLYHTNYKQHAKISQFCFLKFFAVSDDSRGNSSCGQKLTTMIWWKDLWTPSTSPAITAAALWMPRQHRTTGLKPWFTALTAAPWDSFKGLQRRSISEGLHLGNIKHFCIGRHRDPYPNRS